MTTPYIKGYTEIQGKQNWLFPERAVVKYFDI